MEFRILRKDDDRSRFTCGNEVLDEFFRRYAGQNQFRHQIGVTYVLVEAAELLGLNRNTLRKKIRELDIPVVRGVRSEP